MPTYETKITLTATGHPHESYTLCHADEECLLDCQDAWEAAMAEGRAFRRKHIGDKSLAPAGCQCVDISYKTVTTVDGGPHMEGSGKLYGLPPAVVSHIDGLTKKFFATPCVAKCVKP